MCLKARLNARCHETMYNLNLQPPKHPVQLLPLPLLLTLRLPSLRIIVHDILNDAFHPASRCSRAARLRRFLRLEYVHPAIQPPRRQSPLLSQILCCASLLPLLQRLPCVGFEFLQVFLQREAGGEDRVWRGGGACGGGYVGWGLLSLLRILGILGI